MKYKLIERASRTRHKMAQLWLNYLPNADLLIAIPFSNGAWKFLKFIRWDDW